MQAGLDYDICPVIGSATAHNASHGGEVTTGYWRFSQDVSGFLRHGDLVTTARYLKRLEGAEDGGWRAVAALSSCIRPR